MSFRLRLFKYLFFFLSKKKLCELLQPLSNWPSFLRCYLATACTFIRRDLRLKFKAVQFLKFPPSKGPNLITSKLDPVASRHLSPRSSDLMDIFSSDDPCLVSLFHLTFLLLISATLSHRGLVFTVSWIGSSDSCFCCLLRFPVGKMLLNTFSKRINHSFNDKCTLILIPALCN